MPRSYTARTDIGKITSIAAVLKKLRLLDQQLSHGKLSGFVTFNKAYYVVTSVIKEASDNNYFNNPAFIEKFCVCFAQYYFQAVNDSLDANPRLPAAWAKMLRPTKRNTMPNFVLLLMGANAHINHDLPLALLELMDNEKTDDLLKDIVRVDKLLMKSGGDILIVFDEPGKLSNFIKRRCKFLYLRPVMYMVLYWRVMAWRKYRSMRKSGLEGGNFETRSRKIANRFLRLGSYLN